MKRSLLIPLEICQDALQQKKVRQLQVFIWLKINCSGKIKITSALLRRMTVELNVKSIKTVQSAIRSLLDRKWITYSKRSGYHFVKGFDSVRWQEGYDKRTAAEFDTHVIYNFKGFIIGAVIAQLTSVQKKRRWATEWKKRHSKTVACLPQFFPVANKALAKLLNVSTSTAYEWKKLAKKQGFIKIRKNFARIDSVQSQFLNDLRKYGDIPSGRLRFKNGKVCEQLIDEISTNIVLKNRKKIETCYKRGYGGEQSRNNGKLPKSPMMASQNRNS